MADREETFGTSDNDRIDGRTAGAEDIFGLGGDDYIYLGENDAGYGGSGDDQIVGSIYRDFLVGNAGNDTLDGGRQADTVSYAQAEGRVVVSLLLLGFAQDTRSDGIDTLIDVEHIIGSSFNDIIRGNSGDNALNGGKGDDVLRGGRGLNGLNGSAGRDTVTYLDAEFGVRADLSNGQRQDTGWSYDLISNVENLSGSTFDDVLLGNAEANEISGGDGADKLRGEAGDDLLLGGAGTDYLHAGDGNDLLDGGAGDDIIYARYGDDRIFGRDGNDRVDASAGHDVLYGGAGDDQLNGGTGDDTVRGGAGNDLMSENGGRDVFFGGEGSDRFRLSVVGMGGTVESADIIKDFVGLNDGGRDQIEILSFHEYHFVGTNSFSGEAGEVRYEAINGNTFVQGDADGDKRADFMIRLDGLHELRDSDFLFGG